MPVRHRARAHRRQLGPSHVVLGLALAVLALGCTSEPSKSPQVAATGEPMQLDVLVYNIEYGGDESTDEVMRSLDADVVGVLESYNRLPEIAENTGYPYYNVGLQLLSKYPIHEPSGANGLYALIEVKPGFVIAFFNAHLDYVRYGPRLLRLGMPVEEVLASEDVVRTASIDHLVPDLGQLVDSGYPVFLTGDLNQPSSLDYTQAAVGTREGITQPIPWTVSEALLAIGLRDTYRDVHPDPVAVPGITMANPDFRKGGWGDRIDYVYAGGPVTTVEGKLVGEPGGRDVDLPFRPWTSDHRAVLSTFDVTPVPMPTAVSLDRRMLTEGDELTVYYNAPQADATAIAVVPEGEDDATPRLELETGRAGGTTIDTGQLDPGGYQIVLTDADGEELARNQFWVRSRQAAVRIRTDTAEYAVGEPIPVTWDDGPANRWDWVGVYRAGAADPDNDDYLLWGYTGGHDSGTLPPSVSGSLTLDNASQGAPWPLPPGDYVVHYLLTDQYESAGFARFRVTR